MTAQVVEKYRWAPILPFYRGATRAQPPPGSHSKSVTGWALNPHVLQHCPALFQDCQYLFWLLPLIFTLKQGLGQDRQRKEEGTVSHPLVLSCPTPSTPGHVSQVSGTPPLGSQSPYSGEEAVAPHPVAVPPASQFCVSEAALAQTCSRPGWGCLSPSASICFMQGSGRKLCSLIDVQEDVVPAREIHPSQSGLQGNKFREGQQCF